PPTWNYKRAVLLVDQITSSLSLRKQLLLFYKKPVNMKCLMILAVLVAAIAAAPQFYPGYSSLGYSGLPYAAAPGFAYGYTSPVAYGAAAP
ncbi:Uncharacterized protein APZ42_002042, partial [Daphnia magna]